MLTNPLTLPAPRRLPTWGGVAPGALWYALGWLVVLMVGQNSMMSGGDFNPGFGGSA